MAASPRPNIIVILADDLGFSDIGCYGSEVPTPNLDQLAADGVRFTQFYNTPRCSPTRAALLTGLYSQQAGMGWLDNKVEPKSRGFHGCLLPRCVTIAEVLRDAGYFTAMTGKWHLGQQNGTPPWKRGFMRSLNSRYGEVYFPKEAGGPGTQMLYLNGREIPKDSPELGKDWYSTDLFVDWGLKFIDEARAEQKPFFLYIAQGTVHFPLRAPADVIAHYRGKYMQGWDKLREERHARQLQMGIVDPQWPLSPRPDDSPAWETRAPDRQKRFDDIMSVYAAMIECLDRSTGRLVAGLKERGLLDNTLIIFLSDNGGNAEGGPPGETSGTGPIGGPQSHVKLGMNWATLANTPFRRYKHFTHEGGISSPLIAHWPARHPRRAPRQPGETARARDRHHGHRRGPGRGEVPDRVPGQRHFAHGRRELAAGLRGQTAGPQATHFLGARRQQGRARRKMEAGAEVARPLGTLRHGGRPHRVARRDRRARGRGRQTSGCLEGMGAACLRRPVAGARSYELGRGHPDAAEGKIVLPPLPENAWF